MKKDRVIVLLIIFLHFVLILVNSVHGEKVLYLYFIICKNDTITLDEIKVLENYEVPILLQGDYRLVIKDVSRVFYNISFDVIFYLLSEPPIEIECSPVTFILSTEKIHTKEKIEIEIYKAKRLLFSKEISLCDYDPDCRIERIPPTKCLNIKDGICEEGCFEDPDCQLLEKDRFPLWIVILLFFITFIITVLITLYMNRKVQFTLIKKGQKRNI